MSRAISDAVGGSGTCVQVQSMEGQNPNCNIVGSCNILGRLDRLPTTAEFCNCSELFVLVDRAGFFVTCELKAELSESKLVFDIMEVMGQNSNSFWTSN